MVDEIWRLLVHSQKQLSATQLAQNMSIYFSREPLLPKPCKLGHRLGQGAASGRGLHTHVSGEPQGIPRASKCGQEDVQGCP